MIDPPAVPVPPPNFRQRIARYFARLILILHRWAESGWAGSAVGAWGVLQGSVVPGPSDALFVPLGLADPPRVWRLTPWAIGGAVLGGLIAYEIGARALEQVGLPLFRLIGAGPAELIAIERQFAARGWLFVILSTVTPISTKLMCIAAGAFGVPLGEFALALTAGRTLRFLVMGALVIYAGERLTRRVERLLGRKL
jgi:membrane protein YqaA with SNARE-associated domain